MEKKKYYIGYSNDDKVRRKASSGGIGSTIMKYLMDYKGFNTSITFLFNSEKCMYEPIIIHKSSEINICGSVYQDINIPLFLKKHINDITDKIVLSCPPCQVASCRHILENTNKDAFILSFCCSGQTTIEGTWKYYELLGIKKDDIKHMQYRGNGWPSGIQIIFKDGSELYRDNFSYPWNILHKSKLYRPNRCYMCKYDTSHIADISLADPWLPEYINQDKIGHTMFMTNTAFGKMIYDELIESQMIDTRASSYKDYYQAQKPNVEKAKIVCNSNKRLKRELRLKNNFIYYKIATFNILTIKLHIKLIRMLNCYSSWCSNQ